MTRQQRTAVLILAMAVLAVMGSFFAIVANDAMSEAPALGDGVQAAVLPTPTPTATPAPVIYGPDQAIAFAKGYRYSPQQERNLAGLIGTLETANEQLGHSAGGDGWSAESREANTWLVSCGTSDGSNTPVKTYKFLVDLDAQVVQGYNEAGVTLLAFLRQQAMVHQVRPTPTVASAPLGWGVRDYYSGWEYAVTAAPKRLKRVAHNGRKASNPAGFLAIPLRLRNLSDGAAILNPGFYARFGLLDEEGRTVGVVGEPSLLQPTALYCAEMELASFTRKGLAVPAGAGIDTALVFAILPQAASPSILQITVYDGPVVHRYDLSLNQGY